MTRKHRRGAKPGWGVSEDGLRRLEWGVAIALTMLAVVLHVRFLTQAGPLWRDEVNTAEYAAMPSLHEIFASLRYDGFPPLAALLLRGSNAVGFGVGEAGLRMFGFGVGLAFLGALWLACRSLRCPTPLFSLALVGLSPIAVRAVDSIRPYGIGMLLIVATTGLIARAVESPSPKRFLAAGIAAVLSVQSMYQSAFLLFAICAAGAAALLRRRDWKAAGAVALVGVIAALSLLPYRESIAAARDWNVVIQNATSWNELLSALVLAVGPGGPATAVPWLALAAVCVWVAVRPLRSGPAADGAKSSAPVFAGALLVVATVAFLTALKSTRLQVQPWYYAPLLAVLAPALDVTAWEAASTRWKAARPVLALVIAAVMIPLAWTQVAERRTNADIVASLVAKEAVAGDLIVISPWYYGVSFQRYYRGPAEWTTLPPLEDHRIHRYDLLKAAMARPDPIGPVLEKVAGTLKSGHRLWLIGTFPDPRSVERPAPLPPAPQAASGWYCAPYVVTWGREVSYLIKDHVLQAEVVPTGAGRPVNPFENLPLVVVSGWR